MRKWFWKLGIGLLGLIITVVGLGGTPEDLAGWREWFDLFVELVAPNAFRGILIGVGIAILVAATAPSRFWHQAWQKTKPVRNLSSGRVVGKILHTMLEDRAMIEHERQEEVAKVLSVFRGDMLDLMNTDIKSDDELAIWTGNVGALNNRTLDYIRRTVSEIDANLFSKGIMTPLINWGNKFNDGHNNTLNSLQRRIKILESLISRFHKHVKLRTQIRRN